jgi:phenylalanyl-tRNA synthetase beta chain
VHPSLAETGVKRGLQLMAEWSGGKVAPGLVDAYPLEPKDSVVEVTPRDVKRLLGIDLTIGQISELLTRLEFKCEPTADGLLVTAPSHRLDIGEGVVGLADVLEEVARSYGYDNIPETRMADALPPQVGNPLHEWEERVRDLLVSLGLQEIVSYRMTSPERESRVAQYDEYVSLQTPSRPSDVCCAAVCWLRSSNTGEERPRRIGFAVRDRSRLRAGQKSTLRQAQGSLPNEPRRLVLLMTGLRQAISWDVSDSPLFDFYDMKGRIELLLSGLHYTDVSYAPTDSVPYLHPGKAAEVSIGDKVVGVFGELHPLVKDRYEVEEAPILAAEFDLDALRSVSPTYGFKPVADVPPVFEDIAVILDESVPASKVEALIRQTGGKSVDGGQTVRCLSRGTGRWGKRASPIA